MKNPLKRRNPEQEYFSGNMAAWLMENHSISPNDAFKMADEFYKKNKNKLKEALRIY
jgi:hypothetical protein